MSPKGAPIRIKLEKLATTIGEYMHKKQATLGGKVVHDKSSEERVGEEDKPVRVAILGLIDVCKQMTFALA